MTIFTLKRFILKPKPLSHHAIVMAIIIIAVSASFYLKPILHLSTRYHNTLRSNHDLMDKQLNMSNSIKDCLQSKKFFDHINLSFPIATQAFSASLLDTNDLVIDSFKHHHLTIISLQPITHKNQASRYLACGSFHDIQRLMTDWNTDTFLGWITELIIDPCPSQPGSLQLSLLLEKSLEKNN